MKGIIAEWGGTKAGIMYALTSLGYEQSYIEPFSLQDPDRWAEFMVFLRGSQQSGVYDLAVIDAQVNKVKEGSSRAAYGTETGNGIRFVSHFSSGVSKYPRCGEIVCGVFPRVQAFGRLLGTTALHTSYSGSGNVEFPLVGTVAASEQFYQPYDADFMEFASGIALTSTVAGGINALPPAEGE